jgi:rhamnose transport system permease protein
MTALRSWEGFLLAVLILIYAVNAWNSPVFLTVGNQINMFQLSVEKIIVALVMTFVIINGEIDLSVASVMGLAACALGWLFQQGVPAGGAVAIALAIGALCGAFNALFIVGFGIPSLVVTLATMIAFRGFARVLVEDRGITDFPVWFDTLGQKGLIGPVTLAILLFVILAVLATLILQRTAFGRKVYFIGANRAVAEYSGLDVRAVKAKIFIASGLISALAGLLFAARVGAVRGDTMVLLGGVSIFGGAGTMSGTILAILIVLALRNGMALENITGHIQTGVLGILLILSVMVPIIRQTGARLMGWVR